MWLRKSFLLVVLSLILAAGGSSHARDLVATNFNAPSVDLTGVTEILETTEKEIIVPVPGGEGGQETAMTVTAKGPGAVHHFAAFTLFNEEPMPRDFVLVARWPGYVGSGLLWPDFGGMQVLTIQASPGLQPQRINQSHADIFSLRLNPGETVTYVAELTGDRVANLSLWQRSAYDKQQQQLSFFRGVVLGIATLTAVFMLCLFIIRLQSAFPAAALFAFASVAFIALEFGYLPVLSAILPDVAGLEVRVRAVVEALMAAGAIACLLTFIDLRRRSPSIGYPVLGAFIASLVLAVAAWFAPSVGMGLARLLLLVTAIGGFGLIVAFWRRGVIRAQASLVMWCFLLLWTLCSIAAALGWIDIEVVGPVLAWGLVLVLLTMAFTLTQFAFNQGVINSRFFEDSGRRGLALAGAEQVVWDWNEERGSLFVGPELERILGHQQGRISRGGLKGWLELIHPGDRTAYVDVIESAVQRGRGTFSQEFRLRRGDGTYRWFLLRARSLAGDLGRAVRCIGTLTDVTATKRSEEQLLSDAVRDRITGLPNPALFVDRLERAVRRAEMSRNDGIFVLVIDLDRFKHVNDSLGFAVGDSLLLTVARRLSTVMGPDDTLARLHGDRFGIILNARQPHRQIEPYLDHLRKLITRPVPLKPQEIFLTACIGVAQYKLDNIRPEQLLKDAEIALYEAKRQGKDSLVTFTPAMRESQTALVNLEQDLRAALERNQIEVAYQPVMRLNDRELAGFEALVRWRHDRHGLLEPDAFMSLAEELGLMNELGRFVLSQAARQLGIWQRAYRSDEPLFMTVNVSSRELLNRDLIDEVKTVLSREDLVPGTLKLELTETVLMENPELSVRILQRLQHAGVGIACDDFGTGYSALAHLRRLPFDTIKIDRSFLEGEADDETAQIILETIILLAHDLGMDTVAEGIESMDQADRLRELGCDYGQGYLFGEPMTARQVMEAFGGSQSIAGRSSRGGVRSASFWQRLIRRGEDAGQPAGRRESAPVAGIPAAASVADVGRSGAATKETPAEQADMPANSGADATDEADAAIPAGTKHEVSQPPAGKPTLAPSAPQVGAPQPASPHGAGQRLSGPRPASEQTAPGKRVLPQEPELHRAADKPAVERSPAVRPVAGRPPVPGAADKLTGAPPRRVGGVLPSSTPEAGTGPAATTPSGSRRAQVVPGAKVAAASVDAAGLSRSTTQADTSASVTDANRTPRTAQIRPTTGESGVKAAGRLASPAVRQGEGDGAPGATKRAGFTVGLWVASEQDVPVPVETSALSEVVPQHDEVSSLDREQSPQEVDSAQAQGTPGATSKVTAENETSSQVPTQNAAGASRDVAPSVQAVSPEGADKPQVPVQVTAKQAVRGDEASTEADPAAASSAVPDAAPPQSLADTSSGSPASAAPQAPSVSAEGRSEEHFAQLQELASESGSQEPGVAQAVAGQATGDLAVPDPSASDQPTLDQSVSDQSVSDQSAPDELLDESALGQSELQPTVKEGDASKPGQASSPPAGEGSPAPEATEAEPAAVEVTHEPVGIDPSGSVLIQPDETVQAVAATIAAAIRDRAQEEALAGVTDEQTSKADELTESPVDDERARGEPNPNAPVGDQASAGQAPEGPDSAVSEDAGPDADTVELKPDEPNPVQEQGVQAVPSSENQGAQPEPDATSQGEDQDQLDDAASKAAEAVEPEDQSGLDETKPMTVAVVGDTVGNFKAAAQAEAAQRNPEQANAQSAATSGLAGQPAASRRMPPPPPAAPGAGRPAHLVVPHVFNSVQNKPNQGGLTQGSTRQGEVVNPVQPEPAGPDRAQPDRMQPGRGNPARRLPPAPVAAAVSERASGATPPPPASVAGPQERPRPPLRRLLKRQRPSSSTKS